MDGSGRRAPVRRTAPEKFWRVRLTLRMRIVRPWATVGAAASAFQPFDDEPVAVPASIVPHVNNLSLPEAVSCFGAHVCHRGEEDPIDERSDL